MHQFTPGEVKEWREQGRIVAGGAKTRFAAATVGRVQWELIEPLDDTSIFARLLAEKGGGVHHIAVAASNDDELLAAEEKRANKLIMECESGGQYEGIRVACLGTETNLGVILEVFNGIPGGERAGGGTLLTITESGFDQIPIERRVEALEVNDSDWAHQTKLIEKYLGFPK